MARQLQTRRMQTEPDLDRGRLIDFVRERYGLEIEALEFVPYLDLGLRLGEGTGAALCIGLARSAVAILTEMATFASAGVSGAGATVEGDGG